MNMILRACNPLSIRYRRRVTEQAFVDGCPLFAAEKVGIWSPVEVAYFDNKSAFDSRIQSWNSQHPWEYQVLSISALTRRQIPKDTLVFANAGRMYRNAA